MYHSYGIGHMMGYGYGVFGMLIWALILVGIVALVVWIVNRSSRTSRQRRESPQDILKLRYAHGEIDEDEYRKRLEELRR